MLRSRLLLLASWAATTVVATGISAAGVSIVTRDVTDEHRPALRGNDVIALLGAPLAPPPTVAPETTVAVAPEPTAAPDTAPPQTPPPASTAPPTSAAPPATPPSTTTAPPPTVLALEGAVEATFSSRGGTMTAACLDDSIALVSARPNDGFRLVVDEDGPERVRVHFERDPRGDDALGAACRRGTPVERHHADDDPDREHDRDDDRDHDDRDGPRDEERGGRGRVERDG